MQESKSNAASKALDKIVKGMATSLIQWETAIERQGDEGEFLYSLSITTPFKGRANYLVVGRRYVGDRSEVAFHDAETIYEAVKGFADRFANKTLIWKEDAYAK